MAKASTPAKHIVWIGKDTEFSKRICRWTLDWLKEHPIGVDAIVRTSGLELALSSLETPLKVGRSPEMIVVDRSMEAVGIENFSAMVSDCIPECWIIELVSQKDPIQADSSVIYMTRSFTQKDWFNLLQHCFVECPNPQWSKSLTSP